MSQQQNPNLEFVDKALEYVEVTNAATKAGLDEIAAWQGTAADREKLASHLVAVGVAPAADKAALVARLAEPGGALALLKNAGDMIAHRDALLAKATTKSASDLGGPAGDPTAGGQQYNSLTDPFVGRHTNVKKASDRALLRGAT